MATLRLRDDLSARPFEDGGVRYVDVADPRSGASMRLYDHEWLLARRLDGARSYAEVAGWAGENVGFQPSAQDIAGYARTLASLGFFDEPEAVDQVPVEAPIAARGRNVDESSFADLEGGGSARATASSPASHAAEAPIPLVERRHGRVAEESTIPGPAPEAEPERSAPRHRQPSHDLAVGVTQPMALVTTPATDAEGTPKRRGGLAGALVLLLLLVVLALVFLFFVYPSLAPVHVRAQTVAPARDVVHYAQSRGTLKQPPPVVLGFGAAGTVVDVVPVGTTAEPGKTLATLDSYAQLQKELADVRDRETFYENALRVAQAKNHRTDAQAATAKVEEKKKLRTALEEKVGKARIVASSTGSVAAVSVAVGATVEAGAPVLTVVDKRLLADVKVAPGEASLIRAGAILDATSADGKQGFAARVLGVEGDTAQLEAIEPAAGLKDGIEISIVRAKVPHVVPLPVDAVVKSQGGADQVFVITGEVVRARPVTVVERGATEALIAGDGLAPNERVVLAPAPTLQDGQKVTTAP